MNSIFLTVDEGLIVERAFASQANVFMDNRLYTIHEEELRELADEINDRTHGSVNVYINAFTRGCIVLVWNLARAISSDELALSVAFLCRCIARTKIT